MDLESTAGMMAQDMKENGMKIRLEVLVLTHG
jgi:hypothetical protein